MSQIGPSPQVTIAMPVFNGGPLLRVALASIVAQTFGDWELLLIDDGSSDGAIAALPQPLDARIRVLSDGTNQGLAARLNQAIAMARGTYFARMDHDDVAHPERLERQLRYMEANPATDLLGTKCVAISQGSRVLGELPFRQSHEEICRRPWLGFYLAHPSWLGRTAWFRQHGYADPAPFRCEDQELLLRAHAVSTYHALDMPLLAYRLRDSVNATTLRRTRLALAQVQGRYFWQRRDLGGLAGTFCALAARLAKDVLLQHSTGSRSEIAGSLAAEDKLWWSNWLTRKTLSP
ncbi:glycosyltransferase family 2 protein [Devosia alba]|uniref:glycosyltransferase family 2 protein n=1 Tax=Devosia alba TaxID=3152360 RepID=UPI003263ECA0